MRILSLTSCFSDGNTLETVYSHSVHYSHPQPACQTPQVPQNFGGESLKREWLGLGKVWFGLAA